MIRLAGTPRSQARRPPSSRAAPISDDGRGSAGGPASGLAGLAERAARLGGKVEAGPVEGGGYRLRVEVPPSAPAAAPAAAAGVPAGGSGSG